MLVNSVDVALDTHTLSHTSYIVLWLDFGAGRGDAALGRVLGVLFHQLQTGRLGDAAGHPGTTDTLRESEGEKEIKNYEAILNICMRGSERTTCTLQVIYN